MDDAEEPQPKKKKRKKGRGVERAEYALYRALLGPLEWMSDRSVGRFGRFTGSLLYRLVRKRTRLALENLRLVYPDMSEAERERIVRECWKHYSTMALAYLHSLRRPIESIADSVTLVHQENFFDTRARGRGMFLVSAHYGSWETGLSAVVNLGGDFTIIARRLDNQFLDRDLNVGRGRTGMEVVDRRKAARPIVRAIERKSTVILLVDQAVQPQEGVLVPFLGVPAWTTSAPARMALKYDVPIVLLFCEPEGDRTRIEFLPPIDPGELPESERNVEALTARINEGISARIRANPPLWLWMHDRWKETDAKARRKQ